MTSGIWQLVHKYLNKWIQKEVAIQNTSGNVLNWNGQWCNNGRQIIYSSNMGKTNIQLAISSLDSIQKSSGSSLSLNITNQFVISLGTVFTYLCSANHVFHPFNGQQTDTNLVWKSMFCLWLLRHWMDKLSARGWDGLTSSSPQCTAVPCCIHSSYGGG